MEGFVDLRSGDEGGSGDSFWPSFTDIMMVVVMIFMIASTVLILRNWDLVRELRETMDAERAAQEVARFASEVNATLEEQLANAQHEVSLMRMRLMRSQEESRAQAEALADREQRLLALQDRLGQAELDLAASRTRGSELESELQETTRTLAELRSVWQTQERELQEVRGQVVQLETARREQTEEIARLRRVGSEAERLLASLQGDYDSLKVKYDKLVRPARTAQGKHVVEVRYEKRDGDTRIALREPGQAAYRGVTRGELDTRLAALAEGYPDLLYVKIVIPENSGLSYNEAWRFTSDVLEKYDYYHRQ